MRPADLIEHVEPTHVRHHDVQQHEVELGRCQLAERLVLKGHEVTVVTSTDVHRSANVMNGVAIREFAIRGNGMEGLYGEVATYQQYLLECDFDLICIYAAQQWTCDAFLPVLDEMMESGLVTLERARVLQYGRKRSSYFNRLKQSVLHHLHLHEKRV